MPQMMPLLWLSMLMLLIFILFMLISFIYYFYLPPMSSTLNLKPTYKIMNKNWLWSW